MALLVKERKALEKLERSIANYYDIMLGTQLEQDVSLTPEERILAVAAAIDLLL